MPNIPCRAQDLDNALHLQGPIEEVNAIIFDKLVASAIRNAALSIRMVLLVYLALMLPVGVVYAVHSRVPLRICVVPYQVLLAGSLRCVWALWAFMLSQFAD